MRPVFALVSSAASGLRFCGMIEEPVVNASESEISRYGEEHQMMISSAKRDRCIARMRQCREIFQREIPVGD